MTAKRKTLFLMGIGLGAFFITVYYMQRTILLRTFLQQEQADVYLAARSVMQTVRTETERLSIVARDWGLWDATYNFIRNRNPEYTEENLSDTTLRILVLDEMIFLDHEGHVIEQITSALPESDPSFRDDPALSLVERIGLRQLQQEDTSGASGVIQTKRGPMLVVVQPVSNSAQDAPPAGLLVLGKLIISESILQRLSEAVAQSPGKPGIVNVVNIDREPHTAKTEEAEQLAAKGYYVKPQDTRSLLVYVGLRDFSGLPSALIEVRKARTAYELALTALSSQAAVALGTLMLFALLAVWFSFADTQHTGRRNKPVEETHTPPNLPRHLQIGLIIGAFVLFGLAAFFLELLQEFFLPHADVWNRSMVSLFYIAILGAIGVRIALGLYRHQRDAAERAIRASEAHYRTIFETTPSPTLIADPASCILLVNSAAEKMAGYSRAEIEGKMAWTQFIHPADLPRLAQLKEARKRNEAIPRSLDFRIVSGTGKQHDVIAFLEQIPDTEHLVVSLLDTTDLKQIQEQLREKEAFLEQVFNSIQDSIFVLDTQHVIRSVNPATEAKYKDIAPLVGKACYHVLCKRHQACDACPVRQTFATGQGGSAVVEGRDPVDGTMRWKDVYSFPLRDAKTSEVNHVICYERDTTERVKAEESLRAMNELLENTNRRLKDTMERVTALARRAEEASAAKSEFLANLTHELRTPLNGILGVLDLAVEAVLPAETSELLQSARASAHSLLNVINGILEYAEMEQGRLTIENVAFDIREEIPDALRTIAAKAERKNLPLAYRIHPDVPQAVAGDCFRLQQVLLHLVDNAIKFSEKGAVCVVVEREPETDENTGGAETEIHFIVRDTGVGISKEHQELVLSPFKQVDGSSTRLYGGMGLGLSISRRIVEAIGGRLWLQSEIEVGTTVHFTLPFRIAAPDEKQTLPETDLEGLRVLIAESHPLSAQTAQDILERWGASCTVARDGNEALELLREQRASGKPFDLALLDASLDGMSGVEIEAHVAKDPDLCGGCILAFMPLDMAKRGAHIQRPATALIGLPISPSGLLVPTLRLTKRGEARAIRLRADGEPFQPRLRILLAEDEMVCRTALMRLLEKRDCTVYTASTGLEVIELLGRVEVDLVLMDESMPVMDGITATKLIRAGEMQTGAHLRIVGMTASMADGVRSRCLAAGMDDFVCKPVVAEMLDIIVLKARFKKQSHAVAMGDPMPIDIPAALRILGGDVDLLVELLVELLSHEDVIPGLRQAIQNGDARQTMMEAHRLKGAFSNVGAMTARRLASELEVLARAGHMENAMLIWQKLDGEVARLRDFISDREWLKQTLGRTTCQSDQVACTQKEG